MVALACDAAMEPLASAESALAAGFAGSAAVWPAPSLAATAAKGNWMTFVCRTKGWHASSASFLKAFLDAAGSREWWLALT